MCVVAKRSAAHCDLRRLLTHSLVSQWLPRVPSGRHAGAAELVDLTLLLKQYVVAKFWSANVRIFPARVNPDSPAC